MKSFLFFIFSFFLIHSAFARTALIYSIDDYDYGPNYVEVSPEALPPDHYAQLVALIGSFQFTTLTDAKVSSLFEELKKDRRARMKFAGGACSSRRIYIQNYLKKMNIVSGKLYISCPAVNGRMRLKDQVTGHNYTFANFHDTNIVSVGKAFRVMDVQFEAGPVSLQNYLAEIETSQKIRPLKRKGESKGLCYWTISTPSLRYKHVDSYSMRKSFPNDFQ